MARPSSIPRAPRARRAESPPGVGASYQGLATPGPTERGHRPTAAVAEALLDRALPLSEDPDMAAIWELGEELREGLADLDDLANEGEERDWMGFTYRDLADVVGVPHRDTEGRRWALQDRIGVAEQALLAAMEVRHGAPRWLAAAMVEDAIDRRPLRLVAVDLDDAVEFVADHHSTLPVVNPRGLMYAIGIVAERRLVAVATAGTPTGRWSDPHRVLELTRVASDGSTLGAASMLVARLIDLLPRSVRPGATEPALFVTYSLTTEEGTTYRALRDKGLRPTARLRGKRGGGARPDSERSLSDLPKIRWEAGPGAGLSRWDLVDGTRTPDGIVDAAAARLLHRHRGQRAEIINYLAANRAQLVRTARESRLR